MQQAPHLQTHAGIAVACALLLAPMGLGSAAGSPNPVPVETEDRAHAEHELSRTQATALVQKRYGARVVRASSADEGGRHIYLFKLLSESGKVWTVRIDARSGAELP